MTIKKLSKYQIEELDKLFLQCGITDCEIYNIGMTIESNDLIVEYEQIGPYPALNKGIETMNIPFNKPIK